MSSPGETREDYCTVSVNKIGGLHSYRGKLVKASFIIITEFRAEKILLLYSNSLVLQMADRRFRVIKNYLEPDLE